MAQFSGKEMYVASNVLMNFLYNTHLNWRLLNRKIGAMLIQKYADLPLNWLLFLHKFRETLDWSAVFRKLHNRKF